ncbi:hypothetical protein [Bacillus salacetis]|nr:hypothetical protein [Bacillus salacetis]
MKWITAKKKKTLFVLLLLLLFIAGLLDIVYEGLLFQSLPKNAQAYLK